MTHLSDGRAELALKDFLQTLELVTGDVARLLQLLQQLDGPGNIWQKERGREGERENRCECMSVGPHAEGTKGGKKSPFNYINSRARRKALERINGWDNGNTLSQGRLGRER